MSSQVSSRAIALDANGNTTSKTHSTGTTTYTWDYDNRLTNVTLPGSGGTVSYRYDPFGRRTYKSSSSGASVYAYDSESLIEETNSSTLFQTEKAPQDRCATFIKLFSGLSRFQVGAAGASSE